MVYSLMMFNFIKIGFLICSLSLYVINSYKQLSYQYIFRSQLNYNEISTLQLGSRAKSTNEASNIKSSSVFTSSKVVTIEFQPSNIISQAKEGTSLADVAEVAGVAIAYKCRKGECATCKVQVQGKWIKACQTIILAPDDGDILRVNTVPIVDSSKEGVKKPSKFFTPASFFEGVVNNGFGVLGFVVNSLKADDSFQERMKKEAELNAKVAARKTEKDRCS